MLHLSCWSPPTVHPVQLQLHARATVSLSTTVISQSLPRRSGSLKKWVRHLIDGKLKAASAAIEVGGTCFVRQKAAWKLCVACKKGVGIACGGLSTYSAAPHSSLAIASRGGAAVFKQIVACRVQRHEFLLNLI